MFAMSNSSDPLALLKALSPLLDIKGGVVGLEQMQRIVILMKDAKQLVSRCVYLNVLKVTDVQDLLEKFILEGGWAILNTWLVEAKNSENMVLTLEILNILQQLPLKINHLKQNNTPKLVKSFVKTSSCSKVKAVAATLMSRWLGIIKDASTPSDSLKKKSKGKTDAKLDLTKKSNNNNKPPPISKAPSFSKFRKTGLESNSETSKKPTKQIKTVGVKRSSVDGSDSSSSLPDKKPKPEPKPQKKIAISDDFMEAISSVTTTRRPVVKRKPVNKPKAAPVTNSVDKMSPSHSTPSLSGEAGDFTGSPDVREKTPSPVPSPVEPPKPKLNKYGKPMKSVRWLPDERLEVIRYFENEEGERVNVTTQSFKDALRQERILERQKMGDFHHQGEGQWKKPKLIDLPPSLVVVGSSSVEKQIQEEREKSVLQEIFLSLEMVPESPAEPDPEPYELVPPKIIPIDDPNDPGPLDSRSPSPSEDLDLGETPQVEEDNPDLLKNKLREIIQTATGLNPHNDLTNDEASPTAPQEMYYPPMMANGDPNFQYSAPSMMQGPNTFYPNDPNMQPMGHIPQPGMMMPPHMIPPNDQYRSNWRPGMGRPRGHLLDTPRVGGGRPLMPPRFPRGYRGNGPWRPREAWRGQGPLVPGQWHGERRFAR